MNELLTMLLLIGGALLGGGAFWLIDEVYAAWNRRRDVRWIKQQPWHCGDDEPDPAFVQRLRAEIVEEARRQDRARRMTS